MEQLKAVNQSAFQLEGEFKFHKGEAEIPLPFNPSAHFQIHSNFRLFWGGGVSQLLEFNTRTFPIDHFYWYPLLHRGFGSRSNGCAASAGSHRIDCSIMPHLDKSHIAQQTHPTDYFQHTSIFNVFFKYTIFFQTRLSITFSYRCLPNACLVAAPHGTLPGHRRHHHRVRGARRGFAAASMPLPAASGGQPTRTVVLEPRPQIDSNSGLRLIHAAENSMGQWNSSDTGQNFESATKNLDSGEEDSEPCSK